MGIGSHAFYEHGDRVMWWLFLTAKSIFNFDERSVCFEFGSETRLVGIEMEKEDVVYATAVPVPDTQHQHQHQQSVPIQVQSQQHSNAAHGLPIQVQSQVLPGEQAICRGCRSNFIRDPQFNDCDAGYFRCVNCRGSRSFEYSVVTDMCTVQ